MPYTITAVERSLVLLEAVAEHPGVTVSELARLTGNTKSLVFRILYTLEATGYVVKDERRRTYTLGYRAVSLTARRQDHFPLLRAAEPVMDDIARTCDANVNLVVRDGLHSLTLASRLSARASDLFAQVGRRGPLHVGGAPKILLAFAPDEVRSQILASPLEAYTEKTVTDPAALEPLLAQIGRTGLNESQGDQDRGAFSFAAAIRQGDGAVVGALSIAGKSIKLDEKRAAALRDQVREGAQRISEALGLSSRTRAVV
jgi:IclR family KDG regulon transcriptional repressor